MSGRKQKRHRLPLRNDLGGWPADDQAIPLAIGDDDHRWRVRWCGHQSPFTYFPVRRRRRTTATRIAAVWIIAIAAVNSVPALDQELTMAGAITFELGPIR